jgi:hypothetical protein
VSELAFNRIRSTYQFEEFTARGLKQALGFVEGYDRAVKARHDSGGVADDAAPAGDAQTSQSPAQ